MTRTRLEPGVATAVGSLPLDDPADAADLALALQPDLPAAPQLPRRSALEGMLAQVALGMPGLVVDPATGSFDVPDRRHVAAQDDGTPLDSAAWAGTLAFLDASRGRALPVKLQCSGPITLGLALVAAGVRENRAFTIAAQTVRSRVHALVEAATTRAPGTPLVVVLDEPSLTAYGAPSFPLGPDDTIDLLSAGMAAAGPDAAVGVHCCGPTDWGLVHHAGADLLSLPTSVTTPDDAAGLAAFLERGGFIVWGAVPTSGPIGDRDEPHWRRLTAAWFELAQAGCDPVLLRTQALLSPECGMASHRPEQVAHVYGLVQAVAHRVEDQALAARMSVGA